MDDIIYTVVRRVDDGWTAHVSAMGSFQNYTDANTCKDKSLRDDVKRLEQSITAAGWRQYRDGCRWTDGSIEHTIEYDILRSVLQ